MADRSFTRTFEFSERDTTYVAFLGTFAEVLWPFASAEIHGSVLISL
jgi:hypothetical protein